jgi:hypothetical protein
MPNRIAIILGALGLAMGAGAHAAAVDEEGATIPQIVRDQPLGSALGASALGFKRGGTDVVNDARLRGVVTGNSASDLVTGSNFISDGAFSGASGLPIVIQNSGNNVLIQNSTIVNVQLK